MAEFKGKEEEQAMRDQSNCESECYSVDGILHGPARRYGRFILLLTVLLMSVPGMITLAPVFTSAKMDFNCSSYDTDEVQDISSCEVKYDKCGAEFNCSATSNKYAKCREFQFEDSIFIETSTSRFSLVCDKWQLATLATACYFIGFLLGCTVYGRLADRFGRLKLVGVASVNLSLCTIAASQAPTLWLHAAAQLLSGFGCGGTHTVLYTYALEIACTNSRHRWGFTVHHGWAMGVLLGTLIAYFIRDYSWLLMSYGLCAAPMLFVTLPLCESPRWLCSVGRFDDADASLRRMVRFGGKKLSSNFSSKVAHARQEATAAELMSSMSLASHKDSANNKTSGWDLLRTPGMRRLSLSIWLIYFVSAIGFFGISLGVGELGGSILLNQVYCAAAELPARVLAMFASGRMGRRISIVIVFGLSGGSLLSTAILFLFPQLLWLRIASAMVGKFWVTIALDLGLLYAAEAFPTVVRSLGIGTGSTAARAGALCSTVIAHLSSVWRPLPFLVFAIGHFLVMLVAFFVPETKGRQLPDTLQQGEKFVLGHCKHRPTENLVDVELKKCPYNDVTSDLEVKIDKQCSKENC